MMPRNKESPTIAYTRWEPLEEDEEPKPGSGPVRLQVRTHLWCSDDTTTLQLLISPISSKSSKKRPVITIVDCYPSCNSTSTDDDTQFGSGPSESWPSSSSLASAGSVAFWSDGGFINFTSIPWGIVRFPALTGKEH